MIAAVGAALRAPPIHGAVTQRRNDRLSEGAECRDERETGKHERARWSRQRGIVQRYTRQLRPHLARRGHGGRAVHAGERVIRDKLQRVAASRLIIASATRVARTVAPGDAIPVLGNTILAVNFTAKQTPPI
eukprot:1694775-Prymnesium_polylepis.3